MHEMGVAEDILAVVLGVAQDHKVIRVRVRIGRLHAVLPESLRFSFQLASEETSATDALLEIEDVPASLRCQACGRTSAYQAPALNCRSCDSSDVQIASGDELLVEEVELEGHGTVKPESSGQEPLHTHLQEHVAQEHSHN